MSCEGCVILE